jgi:release factor glutamine methyltransferase
MNTDIPLRCIGDNSIEALLALGQEKLYVNSDSALLDAQILLAFVLDKPRSYLFTWPEKNLTDEQVQQFADLLARRHCGEPIAYIIGEKEFWSLPLKVSKATLIPRPDTETLVELVLEHLSGDDITCLDLGTGTGAIALALASEKPSWQIDALDFNADAVKLAQQNADNLKLAWVNIYQSDWFSKVEAGKKFDVIVSNPPYIDCDDENLTQGDVRFEPTSALVANEQGLADIKFIAKMACEFLTSHGRLYFEHGFEQGKAVRNILSTLGFDKAQTVQDLNGQDRITWAVLAD